MNIASGRLEILGPEGWEPVGKVTSAILELDPEHLAVQTELEHWCGDDPDLHPDVVQLGAMRFCSGCGAWLDHRDARP